MNRILDMNTCEKHTTYNRNSTISMFVIKINMNILSGKDIY